MGTDHRPLVLLTGASGYIGGRLLRTLEAAGCPVRCLARHPEFLRSRVSSSTQVIHADCLDRASLAPAMAGVQTAYYFVHSMGSAGQFEAEDRQAAQNFADSAREQGVERIVYLGGLGNQDQALSAHLRSRHEVADIPTTKSELPMAGENVTEKKGPGRVTIAPEEKFLVGRVEAADMLSISRRALDYLVANKLLTARRIGTRVLIPVADLRRFSRGDHPARLAG